MKDNKGFSLVELIVVIAIMAILVTAFAFNLGRLNSYRAKECRTKILSSLENARLVALSKSTGGSTVESTDTYLVFVKNNTDGCNYCISVVKGEVDSVKKISKNGVTISYTTSKNGKVGTSTEIGSFTPSVKGLSTNSSSTVLQAAINAGTKVAFSRQNGALLPLANGDYIYGMFASSAKYSYNISIHPKTGNIEKGDRTKITS